jgi:hypothetical protein
MIYLFSLFTFLFPKEINLANSVEWLCYESGTIALVKVDSFVEHNNFESDGEMMATIIKQYKGTEPILKTISINTKTDYYFAGSFNDMIGKERFVFLKDQGCSKYCSYTVVDEDRAVVDPQNPGSILLKGDFTYLKNKTEIEAYIIDCVEKLKGKTANKYFLEVPYESEAYGALYSGSSCYLMVPDVLYPKATKGMN